MQSLFLIWVVGGDGGRKARQEVEPGAGVQVSGGRTANHIFTGRACRLASAGEWVGSGEQEVVQLDRYSGGHVDSEPAISSAGGWSNGQGRSGRAGGLSFLSLVGRQTAYWLD